MANVSSTPTTSNSRQRTEVRALAADSGLDEAQAAVAEEVGAELRRRRQFLKLSIRQAAAKTRVSHTVISGIERGTRLPTLRTYEHLRKGLGLDAPAQVLMRLPEPSGPLEEHLVRLAACLWASGAQVAIADLAAALALPASAVREQLPHAARRLAACGVRVTDDSVEIRISPMKAAGVALELLGRVTTERRRRALSDEAITALAFIGWHREATRRDLENLRGDECESLLSRLLEAGYITAVRDMEGRHPNRYRLTNIALDMFGVASLEELHERVQPYIESATDADTHDATTAELPVVAPVNVAPGVPSRR